MTKQYKVFENDKCILIRESAEGFDQDAEIIKFFSQKQLPEAVNSFSNSGKKTLVIISDDTKKAWKSFKKMFEFIEAAGGLVFNSQRKALFIFRKNKWDLPKGKIDKGEKRRKAAIREVEEECGIKGLKIEKKLLNTYHIYSLNGKKVLKKTSWFKMKSGFKGILVPQADEDITKAEWLNEEQIKEALKNTYPAIREVCKSGFDLDLNSIS